MLLALMVTGCVCAGPVLDVTVRSYLPTGPARTFQVTGRLREPVSAISSGTFCSALPSMRKPGGTVNVKVSPGAGSRTRAVTVRAPSGLNVPSTVTRSLPLLETLPSP